MEFDQFPIEYHRFQDTLFQIKKKAMAKLTVLVVVLAVLYFTASIEANPTTPPPLVLTFERMHKFLTCAPVQVDQLAMVYDCEPLWDAYRPEILETVQQFELCDFLGVKNLIERCKYDNYTRVQSLLGEFYRQVVSVAFSQNELCYCRLNI